MPQITVPSEREQMISLLVKLYGKLKEDPRIDFESFTLKQISDELGYSQSQFSRIVNPPHGEEKGMDSYRRVIQRLQPLVDLKQLKEKQQKERKSLPRFRTAALALALLSLVLLCTLIYQVTTPKETLDDRLNSEQMNAVVNLQSDYIQYRIGSAVLLFHASLKQGIYKQETLPAILKELQTEVSDCVLESRRILKQAKLKAPNGRFLDELMAEVAENDIPGNFKESVPIITDVSLPTRDVQILMMKKMKALQTQNKNRLEILLSGN